MNFIYWLSHFSREAIAAEMVVLGILLLLYFMFLIFRKRRLGVAKGQVPDHVVKAFISDLMGQTDEFKSTLFGEGTKLKPTLRVVAADGVVATPAPVTSPAENSITPTATGNDAETQEKLNALNAALEKLTQEKIAADEKVKELENKVANPATAPAEGGGDTGALQAKLSQLESRLAEYAVIEDDLANLKKFMQENKKLREELEATKGGAGIAATTPPTAEAQQNTEPVVAAPASENPTADAMAELTTKNLTTPAPTQATEAAQPSPVPASEPAVKPPEAAATPTEPTVAAAPTTPTPEPTVEAAPASPPPDNVVAIDQAKAKPTETATNPVAEKNDLQPPSQQDAELLKEFENMLNG